MYYFVVPDLHGRDVWKTPVADFMKEHPTGVVVFLGDYCDSFDKTDKQILDNLVDVILLKEQHPDTVKLLIGNHDEPYLHPEFMYQPTGYRHSMAPSLRLLFDANRHLFQLCYGMDNAYGMFSHAGLAADWLTAHVDFFKQTHELMKDDDIADDKIPYWMVINEAYRRYPRIFYEVTKVSGGHDPYAGPLWVRPKELYHNVMEGMVQFVGHTPQEQVIYLKEKNITKIALTDCLASTNQFLQLELLEYGVVMTPRNYDPEGRTQVKTLVSLDGKVLQGD